MNTPAVSKARLQRAVRALEGLGKTVTGLRCRPDGSIDVLLTADPQSHPVADDGWEAYEKQHGHG